MYNRVYRKPASQSDATVPVYDSGAMTTLPTTKRICPRPIAVNIGEAIVYRDNPPTLLVRIARNVHAVIDGKAMSPLFGMRGFMQRMEIACPFAKVGDIVYFKESWSSASRYVGSINHAGPRYKADWPDDTQMMWQASASMPLWATRNLRKVTSVQCVQAQATTVDQRAAAMLATPYLFKDGNYKNAGVYYGTFHWMITLGDVESEQT